MPMSTMSLYTNLLPRNDFERMSAGHFDPQFSHKDNNVVPDSWKPLIYVTHPDDMEDEIWVPPPQEDLVHESDTSSDDGTCSCYERSLEADPADSELEVKEAMGIATEHKQLPQHANELCFQRTGVQNRAVHTTDSSAEMIYYVDIPWRAWGTSLTVRRGDRNGEVAADVSRLGPGKPIEITFSDPQQRPFL